MPSEQPLPEQGLPEQGLPEQGLPRGQVTATPPEQEAGPWAVVLEPVRHA